jgi:hypothetical protein
LEVFAEEFGASFAVEHVSIPPSKPRDDQPYIADLNSKN